MHVRIWLFTACTLTFAACNAFSRLEPAPDAPNEPGDIGATLPNDPTDPTIDTDVIVGDDTDVDDTDPPVAVVDRLITAAADTSCAILDDDSLYCWGRNTDGQAAGLPGTFERVDLGDTHGCAIRTDGTIGCWGNAASQRTAAPAGTFTDLSCGDAGCCALNDAGSPTCWGAGLTPPADVGSLGAVAVGPTFVCGIRAADNSMTCWGVGPAVDTAPSGTFLALSAGDSHVCAIDTNRAIICWGADAAGQLDLPEGSDFIRISSGGDQSCAIDDLGQSTCWGTGQGTPGPGLDRIALGARHGCGWRGDQITCWGDATWFQGRAPITEGAVQVSVGSFGHACYVDTSGRASCFGSNTSNKATAPNGNFVSVSAGYDHTCGVLSDGSALCWGGDGDGQATPPPDAGQTYSSVTAGRLQTCAIAASGLVCWGRNYAGVPPTAGTFLDAELGSFHRCVVSGEGTAACLGSAAGGRTAVPAGQTWTDIAAAFDNSCGVTAGGAALCWGVDTDGKSTPPAGSFSRVTTGEGHSCGIKTDGTLACWGPDAFGLLDPPAGRFTDLDAGNNTTCAVASTGALRCWGERTL
jgi:hypothetical protein